MCNQVFFLAFATHWRSWKYPTLQVRFLWRDPIWQWYWTMGWSESNANEPIQNCCYLGCLSMKYSGSKQSTGSQLEMKDEDEVLPLSACQRQLPLHTSITSETRDFVTAFWKSETRVSPNKKDICKHRIEAKCVIKHPIHLLDDSQVMFFLQCNPWWPWLLCTKFVVFGQHTRLAVQYQIDSFLPAITLGQTVPIWYFLGNNHYRYQFRAP